MRIICTVVFESGAILQYLAEKYHELIASEDPHDRINTITWHTWGSSALSTQAKVQYFELVNC
jgi:glutathione S-transferase